MNNSYVPEALRKAAEIYEQRNLLYGDNYRRFGPIMKLLFPDGLMVKYDDDWNRLGILVQVVSKLTRYAQNFKEGGHADSLDDMAVYAMMLRELDTDFKAAGKVEDAQVLKDPDSGEYAIKIERDDGVVVYGRVSKEGAENLLNPSESAWAYDVEIYGYEGTG